MKTKKQSCLGQEGSCQHEKSAAESLPPILTLREFEAEMERKYGTRAKRKGLKSLIGEAKANE
jgi:hypothetical protein